MKSGTDFRELSEVSVRFEEKKKTEGYGIEVTVKRHEVTSAEESDPYTQGQCDKIQG